MGSLENLTQRFKDDAWPVILDPEGEHSEFVPKINGDIMHGRKRDYGRIKVGSQLYWQWINLWSSFMQETCERPDMIVGTANGTNPVALDLADQLGWHVSGVATLKPPDGIVILGSSARTAIEAIKPKRVKLIDDEGTTGTTTARLAVELLDMGVEDLEAIYSSQRREELEYLGNLGIAYRSMIVDPLPTFTAEDCRTLPEGLCRQGLKLNEYGT